jgi:hypothetical protein
MRLMAGTFRPFEAKCYRSRLSLLGSNTAAAQLIGNLPSMSAWDNAQGCGFY